MIRSVLIGLLSGQRALAPLATVADAARRGALPRNNGAPELLGHPVVAGGLAALALAELGGDKMKTAPNRTVPSGLIARSITSAVAGAALAPRDRRVAGALAATATAVATSYLGLHWRLESMARWGQTATGLVEDAMIVGGSAAVVNARR